MFLFMSKGSTFPQICDLWTLPSLKLTFSPLKIDGWNRTFLLGRPTFRGEHVSFREGIIYISLEILWALIHPKPSVGLTYCSLALKRLQGLKSGHNKMAGRLIYDRIIICITP